MAQNTYEALYLTAPETTDEALGAFAEKFKQLLSQHAGQLTAEDRWGRRRLAYPIGGYREANYVLLSFTSAATAIREADHLFRVTDGVLRHLVVRKEMRKKPPAPVRKPPVSGSQAESGEAPGTPPPAAPPAQPAGGSPS